MRFASGSYQTTIFHIIALECLFLLVLQENMHIHRLKLVCSLIMHKENGKWGA